MVDGGDCRVVTIFAGKSSCSSRELKSTLASINTVSSISPLSRLAAECCLITYLYLEGIGPSSSRAAAVERGEAVVEYLNERWDCVMPWPNRPKLLS